MPTRKRPAKPVPAPVPTPARRRSGPERDRAELASVRSALGKFAAGDAPLDRAIADKARAALNAGLAMGSSQWKARAVEWIGRNQGLSASDAATLLDKYATFVPVGGGGPTDHDYSPGVRTTHLRKVERLVHENPLARRNLWDLVDFTIGTGVTWASADELVNVHLGRTWDHPTNALQRNHPVFAESLFKDGELLIFVEEILSDGVPVFGAIPGTGIVRIIKDSRNRLRDVAAVVRHPLDARKRGVYRLLGALPFEGAAPIAKGGKPEWYGALAQARGFEDLEYLGDGFYFALNRVLDATHGKPLLLAALDWYDGNDEAAWSMVERLKLANMLLWVVTIEGCQTEQQLIEKAKALGVMDQDGTLLAPTPNSIRLQGAGIKYEAVSGDIDAAAHSEAEHITRNMPLTLCGLPEAVGSAWGGDANRATLFKQTGPMARRLMRLQGSVADVFRTLLNYSLDCALRANVAGINAENVRAYEITMQELASGEEVMEFVGALQTAAGALGQAVTLGLTDKAVARFVFEKMLQDRGFDLQFIRGAVKAELPEEGGTPAAEPEEGELFAGREKEALRRRALAGSTLAYQPTRRYPAAAAVGGGKGR